MFAEKESEGENSRAETVRQTNREWPLAAEASKEE
jgi:hypothetical protein